MARTHSPTPRRESRLVLTLSLAFCFVAAARAQQAPPTPPTEAPVVTAAATAAGVRFAVLGPVHQTRLEVYDAAGAPVFDTGFRAGNVRDFAARGARGEPLADGTYQCVVSARDVAGRLSVKQAAVLLAGGQATLSLGGAEAAGAAAPAAQTEEPGAAVVATHDGRDGALTSTAGDLTLRTGDVLAGRDVERVRVTSDGRVGIGTDRPEAALDVAGAVRAAGGFRFPDGSTLNSKGGRLTLSSAAGDEIPGPDAAGTGTQNRLAKWAETGGAGALTDSTFEEDASGNVFNFTGTRVVVGGQQPFFEAQRNSSGDILQRFWNTGSGGAKLRYVAATGATSQIQLTDGLEWLSSIAGNNSVGLQFRVRPQATANSEAGLDASAVMTLARTGNVGVGTASPQVKFEVNGAARFSPGGSGGVVNIGSPGGTETGMSISNPSTRGELRFDGSTLKLVVGANVGPPPPTSGLAIDTAGNVGVGTTSPNTGKLNVVGGAGQPAVFGTSANRGVWGVSTGSSYGVYGESVNGIGMQGVSTSNVGVGGISTSSFGVAGSSSSSYGVFGTSASNSGVRGETASGSITSPGVHGVSTGAGGVGVRGDGTTGVYGVSTSGVGVTGESTTGFAVYANGNAGQALNKGGFVKAMVYVDPFLPADQYIVRCYNGLTNTSFGNCGFTMTRDDVGRYRINFGAGFNVANRFLSLTLAGTLPTGGGAVASSSTEVSVLVWTASSVTAGVEFVDNAFFLIVY